MRFLRRRHRERDLDAEIQAHFEIEIQERIARGESPEKARVAARRQFGNIGLVKETTRGVWRTRLLDRLGQDARHVRRHLWGTFGKEPGFFLLTVLTLALVLASNTLLFGAVNRLLLRNRPGSGQPERLVDVVGVLEDGFENRAFSYPNYIDYRDGSRGFTPAAYSDFEKVGMRAESGLTEAARVAWVSGNFFEVLAVRAAAGRLLEPADDRPDAEPVVVISHRVWQKRFGGAATVIGEPLRLGERTFTIAGVVAPEFLGTDVFRDDAWIPLALYPQDAWLKARDALWLGVVARLEPGTTLDQARAEASAMAANLQRHPENEGLALRLVNHWYHGFQEGVIKGLVGMCLVVLLMACANIGAVGLSRAIARRPEIVARLALGAPRSRIAYQLIAETVALFTPAAAVGIFLARWAARSEVLAPYRQIEVDISPDWRVTVFALGLALAAAVVSGLTPALHAVRTDLTSVLKEKSGGIPHGRLRLQNVVIVVQVAVSVALLTVGALYFNAIRDISASRAFNPRDVHVLSVDFRMASMTGDQSVPFVLELLPRVSALPRVSNVAAASDIPQNDEPNWVFANLWKPGQTPVRGKPDLSAMSQAVTPGYFRTLGLPLIAGRDFTRADSQNAPRVAILSEGAAKKLWPGGNAVGQIVYTCPNVRVCRTEIVGVAAEVTRKEPGRLLYVPYAQRPSAKAYVAFRSASPEAAIPAIRTALTEMNPHLPVVAVHPLSSVMHSTFFYQYLIVWSAGVMGIIAVAMAALGIYGVTSHAAASRIREIGIRTALGARPALVIRSLTRRSLALTAGGLPLGCAAGLFVAQSIPEIEANAVIYSDPWAYAAACFGALGIAFIAAYLPARRAAKADPMTILRHE